MQLPAGLVEDFAERQRNEFQVRGYPPEVRLGETAEKMVLAMTAER
jgi:hypothetical protein